ncbi:uncharacterized protein L201_002801 [Kwoniella dendrophila CBS 6074]|uniref:Integral membrane protein n=1 Tax=Kwoniella dendrophila CBS 6074 TaxID=1295534 RepID=A0AAX4JR43_9TREE
MVETSKINIAAALSGYIIPPLLPIPLLRLIPIISSTVSLQWAIDEYQFLSSWKFSQFETALSTDEAKGTNDIDLQKSNEILPKWFRDWGPRGTLILFSSFPWSVGSALTNIYQLYKQNQVWSLNSSKTFYTLGAILACSHMLFGPKALGLLKKIRNGEPDGKPLESLSIWLRMHTLRTFITDLPAVSCFVVAAVKATQGR